jgi:hypothetical protein
VKLRRVFHVIATADNDSGFLAEFNSELGWFSVILYDEKAQRELKELLDADDGNIMLTFGRVPRVTGTCEVIPAR